MPSCVSQDHRRSSRCGRGCSFLVIATQIVAGHLTPVVSVQHIPPLNSAKFMHKDKDPAAARLVPPWHSISELQNLDRNISYFYSPTVLCEVA